jgi:hypothetical protein
MDKEKLDNLIHAAAEQQEQELSWIGNLYQKRLQELQKTEAARQEWLKSQDEADKLDE